MAAAGRLNTGIDEVLRLSQYTQPCILAIVSRPSCLTWVGLARPGLALVYSLLWDGYLIRVSAVGDWCRAKGIQTEVV